MLVECQDLCGRCDYHPTLPNTQAGICLFTEELVHP